MTVLLDTDELLVVAFAGRVVETNKKTGASRICGEHEADRYWDRFEQHGNQGN